MQQTAATTVAAAGRVGAEPVKQWAPPWPGNWLTAVQPIVEVEGKTLVGHEMLSRPRPGTGIRGIEQLLSAAAQEGTAADLSRWLREDGLEKTAGRIAPCRLSLNTHPTELTEPRGFVASLGALARRFPDLELTVEIHQETWLEPKGYRELREGLRDLGIRVSFDHFGEGYSRWLELASSPPDSVKFARCMVRGIDRREAFRLKVLAPLVRFVRSLGSTAVAVGIETEAELESCRQLGFEWAQGYHVGRPWTIAT